MKRRVAFLFPLTILCLALSTSAFAGDFGPLYNNGPTNGTNNAYFIDAYVVSDSFLVDPTSDGISVGFGFAEWVPAGATPLTVDWAIGTSSFGSDVASGTGGMLNYFQLCSNGSPFNGGICGGDLGYDVYDSQIQVNPWLHLTPGQTYWLTLTNATDSLGGRDGWDINSGPSQAYHNLLGTVPSESFTIFSGLTTTLTGTTPEPDSIVLFGSGILVVVDLLRRKLSL
ncbi:MAG: hypothetical protein WCC92_13405 [Candidatus Korobacteraceae bacterium]